MFMVVSSNWFLVIVGFFIYATGCVGDGRRGEPLRKPISLTMESEKNGQVLYMQHCYSCHLGGEGGLGPSLTNKSLPGFIIKTQIRLGLGKMPSFGQEKISSRELDDIVDYIAAAKRQDSLQEFSH